MERFAFDQQIARMAEKNLLYEVVKAFCDPRIDLTFPGLTPAQANIQMGYVFEELIRIGAEQSNEEAGEHFTPREVIKLMVNLLLSPEQDLRKSHVVKTIYDPACGTGGMLSVAERYIRDLKAEANRTCLVRTGTTNPGPSVSRTCSSRPKTRTTSFSVTPSSLLLAARPAKGAGRKRHGHWRKYRQL